MQLVLNDVESQAPVILHPPPMTDDEFFDFCQLYPDFRVERTAAYLRDNPIQPTPIGHARKPWVNNRAELRELRNEAWRRGNHGGAEMYQRELDMAEVYANAAAGPTSVDTWGGRVELQQP